MLSQYDLGSVSASQQFAKQVKAGRLTAKSVQSLQSALAEEQRGGEIYLKPISKPSKRVNYCYYYWQWASKEYI